MGIILTPDIRSKAYLRKILDYSIKLDEIIFLNDKKSEKIFSKFAIRESRKCGFDVSESVLDILLENKINFKEFDYVDINNLDLNNVNVTRYPMVKLLNFLPDNHSLFETVIVAANDKLVELFLSNKIKFTDIQKKLFKIIKKKEFQKFKKILPLNISDITNLNNYVRLKIDKNNI